MIEIEFLFISFFSSGVCDKRFVFYQFIINIFFLYSVSQPEIKSICHERKNKNIKFVRKIKKKYTHNGID
jgi:hypothetical protein